MKRPRKIEYEIHQFEETYIYWQQYAEELDKYIDELEQSKGAERNKQEGGEEIT